MRGNVVCLCGSTRFIDAFRDANLRLTCAGYIVLSIGCDMKSDHELFSAMKSHDLAELKAGLDILHYKKIDAASWIFVLNVDGYVGESTMREIKYAEWKGKEIHYFEFKNEAGVVLKHPMGADYVERHRPFLDGEKPNSEGNMRT